MSHTNEQPRDKLWHMLKDIRFGMFTTRHENGHLHSRPMTTQNRSIENDNSLWFFMSRKGDPVADILVDDSVDVVYADPGKDTYISVSGDAAIVDDMAKKTALWNKFAEAWFPGGVGDPDLALVQVKIIHAHYWDVKSNKIVQLYEMAKAVFTGEPPRNMADTGEIRLRSE